MASDELCRALRGVTTDEDGGLITDDDDADFRCIDCSQFPPIPPLRLTLTAASVSPPPSSLLSPLRPMLITLFTAI